MSSLDSSATRQQGAQGQTNVNSTSSKDPDRLGAKLLSIAVIGPERTRREAIGRALVAQQAAVTREFASYPEIDDLPRLLLADYDILIVDLDSNLEHALELIENICAQSSVTVMACSAHTDPEVLVRCMRAGAREFLPEPLQNEKIAEALVRASVKRTAVREGKKTAGKLFVFIGSKGGAGATTVASNFAVALAQQSSGSALLIDLNFPLGDAALGLGIISQFSTADALQNAARLDSNFLSTLLIKHDSGLNVLAAPDKYVSFHVTVEALDRLLAIARQNFDYVIVDAGSKFNVHGGAMLESASTVYLVTQVGVAELRNSNFLISRLFKPTGINVEVVLNRFTPRALGIDEDSITRALTRPANWKIPSDFSVAQNAQNTATPLALKDSAVSRVIRDMSRAASGVTENSGKKKRLSLFR